MPIKALIVDDEPLAREGLRMLLSNDSDVSNVAEAKDGRQAVAAIRASRPDLVFLDVQMPEMDGFSVVREIGAAQMPPVVFVTAHDKFALQAFEINAIDYLLKPVTRERFLQALARAKSRLALPASDDASQKILGLLETIVTPAPALKRLAIRSAGKTVFLDVSTMDWIQAEENYVQIYAGRTKHMLHVPLNTLAKSLDPELFVRIHRSIIVNVSRIRELQPDTHGEYIVVLENNTRVRSGRTYSDRLKALAANPF